MKHFVKVPGICQSGKFFRSLSARSCWPTELGWSLCCVFDSLLQKSVTFSPFCFPYQRNLHHFFLKKQKRMTQKHILPVRHQETKMTLEYLWGFLCRWKIVNFFCCATCSRTKKKKGKCCLFGRGCVWGNFCEIPEDREHGRLGASSSWFLFLIYVFVIFLLFFLVYQPEQKQKPKGRMAGHPLMFLI